MPLSQSQKTMFVKARTLGSGSQIVTLHDAACRALIAIAARDLGCAEAFPDLPQDVPELFSVDPPASLGATGANPLDLYEHFLAVVGPDADTYFCCLAALHKYRLKYHRIHSTQPFPTSDQVGPRSLLQFGMVPAPDLAALLVWRKWLSDLDNRAGQETGYLFEPIITGSLGGASYSAKNSPVRRRSDPSKGRQVDCLRMNGDGLPQDAYEIKLRVTIAASGQGRWGEEKEFPADCRASGLTPILLVLDPTDNPKLIELVGAFETAGGHAFIGQAAWDHMESEAGDVMGGFVEKYVREPLSQIIAASIETLPDLTLRFLGNRVSFQIGTTSWHVARVGDDPALAPQPDEMPDDIGDSF